MRTASATPVTASVTAPPTTRAPVTAPFEPSLLQTFLAVAQTLSFTQAADRLGLGQPTVSQHIRRLEEAAGRVLVTRDTRSVSLTVDGEAMIGFARQILGAQEQAQQYFSGQRPTGRLRVGMADDLALTPMPSILREFRREYPGVDLDLTVDSSGTLYRRLGDNRLDLFVGKQLTEQPGARLVRRDRLVWVGIESTKLDATKPLPLAVYPHPSLSRRSMLEALERVGRPWRSACVCRGVNGLIAAVSAGLGITAMAASLVPSQLTRLGSTHKLPELGHVDLVLLTNPRTADRPASRALASAVLASGARTLKP